VQPARSAAAAPSVGEGLGMPVTSSGAKPAGFEARLRVDPRPGDDGVIRGDSPLTVNFDLCGSTPGEGSALTYLFDFDFDDVADAVGTGDACQQHHKYNVHSVPNPGRNVSFRSNVCVVSGDPRNHGPNTYFSCRTFTVGLPVDQVPGKNCIHDLCTQGDAVTYGCDTCANRICDVDPYCCNTAWDGICVGEVLSVCGNDSCGDDGVVIKSLVFPSREAAARH
jgi:hypothetical protein